jgi:thymidylate synthase (FAD)
MQLIHAFYEIFGETPMNVNDALKFIELGGRTCYKSEDAITDNSAAQFAAKMVRSGHHSVIEHSNLVFVIREPRVPIEVRDEIFKILGERMKYHKVEIEHGNVYVAGNYRAWHQTKAVLDTLSRKTSMENEILTGIIRELKELFNYSVNEEALESYRMFEKVIVQEEIPTRLRQYTVRIVCDRGVSHEIVRHRPFAFSQESTRYVNYQDKGMTFIIPVWTKNIEPKTDHESVPKNLDEFEFAWIRQMEECEGFYNRVLKSKENPEGWTPEKARSGLPNSLKTEIIVTGFQEDWGWMRHVRVPKAAHPQYREISVPLFKEFEDRGWLEPTL